MVKNEFSLRNNTVYRFDTRSPVEINKAGCFLSKGIDMDLSKHASGLSTTNEVSGYISTSFSKKAALNFAGNRPGYLYTLKKPAKGFDVNKILGKKSPFPLEKEFAVPLEIPFSNIKSVKKIIP